MWTIVLHFVPSSSWCLTNQGPPSNFQISTHVSLRGKQIKEHVHYELTSWHNRLVIKALSPLGSCPASATKEPHLLTEHQTFTFNIRMFSHPFPYLMFDIMRTLSSGSVLSLYILLYCVNFWQRSSSVLLKLYSYEILIFFTIPGAAQERTLI